MRLNVFLSVPLYMSFSAHSQCHQGWREFEGKCYYFSTDAKSWNDANAFCMTQRSSLMSIQDVHERVRRHAGAKSLNVLPSFHTPG